MGGAKLFKAKCATCHSANAGGGAKQGPNLYGIMGTKAASAKDFKFTKVLKKAEVEWNNETMFAWLANPKLYVRAPAWPSPASRKRRTGLTSSLTSTRSTPTLLPSRAIEYPDLCMTRLRFLARCIVRVTCRSIET